MSRREARLERENLKKLQEAEKSARLRERPIETKSVRAGADPGSVFQMKMTWTIAFADIEGAWRSGTVRQWSADRWDGDIAPKLSEWTRLTWSEIDRLTTGTGHKMHHAMPTEAILDEAQERLIEIDRLEETLFRFRLGNLPRLWGFRRVADFHVLWDDPFHEIYPTDPS